MYRLQGKKIIVILRSNFLLNWAYIYRIFLIFQGFGIAEEKRSIKVPFIYENKEYTLSHGSVVIAAVTSCTNTSNPSVMLGAGRSICK